MWQVMWGAGILFLFMSIFEKDKYKSLGITAIANIWLVGGLIIKVLTN